jgi:hypothetical protein
MIKLNPIYYTNGDGLYASKQEGMREFRNDLSGFSNITFEGKGGNETFAFNVEGIRFNVSKEEMINVFQTCTIIKGVIQERCVIGKVSSSNCIIPVDSKRYLETIENDTAFRYNNYKVKDLQPGDLVKMIDEEDTYNFVGKIYVLRTEEIKTPCEAEEVSYRNGQKYVRKYDTDRVIGIRFTTEEHNNVLVKTNYGAKIIKSSWSDTRTLELNPKSKNNKIKFVQKGGLFDFLNQDLENMATYQSSRGGFFYLNPPYYFPERIAPDKTILKIKIEKAERVKYPKIHDWVDCSEELLIQEVNIDEEIKFDKIVKNYYDLIGQFSLKIIFYV